MEKDCEGIVEKRNLKRRAEGQESHKQIEKRRRDRINQSLMDLSQAIPAAFAKQSTRRLEKAEILEMTVDYIRAIGNTEIGSRFEQGDWYSSDIWADFIHHYQCGYSDCMRELQKYYQTVAGRHDQDENTNRVFSYLQSRYRPESSVANGVAYKRQKLEKEKELDELRHTSLADQPRMISALTRSLDLERQNLEDYAWLARRAESHRFWTADYPGSRRGHILNFDPNQGRTT